MDGGQVRGQKCQHGRNCRLGLVEEYGADIFRFTREMGLAGCGVFARGSSQIPSRSGNDLVIL